MKRLLLCLFFCSVLCYSSHFVRDDLAWDFALFGRNIAIVVILFYALCEINKTKITERFILSVAIIFQVLDVALNVIDYFVYINFYYIWFPWLFLVFIWLVWISKRSDNYKNDKINNDNFFLCFWRPKNRSIFNALLGAPFGSVAVYANGVLYSFKWSKNNFCSRYVSEKIELDKFYWIVDTGRKIDDEGISILYTITGTPARQLKTLGLRIACVLTIRPILAHFGREFIPHYIEYIPSFYALKIKRLIHHD